MDLERVVNDIADALSLRDSSGVPFRSFQAGVGPYGEPQLVKLIAEHLRKFPHYELGVRTMRTPDLMITGSWALEIKIARPFGDNGKLAENWSVNLLHPYVGNTSLLGDCLKLRAFDCNEQKAVLAIGYEHNPPQVSLEPLARSFEVIATEVLSIQLGQRVSAQRTDLIHPVHQRLIVMGWTVN
ncbi:MAG: hypothetical protein WBW33_21265 [Bryobacteraceae bacterium]